ncbi:MAG: hypothetical protein V4735_09875 [Pseudomonadota bacterium]
MAQDVVKQVNVNAQILYAMGDDPKFLKEMLKTAGVMANAKLAQANPPPTPESTDTWGRAANFIAEIAKGPQKPAPKTLQRLTDPAVIAARREAFQELLDGMRTVIGAEPYLSGTKIILAGFNPNTNKTNVETPNMQSYLDMQGTLLRQLKDTFAQQNYKSPEAFQGLVVRGMSDAYFKGEYGHALPVPKETHDGIDTLVGRAAAKATALPASMTTMTGRQPGIVAPNAIVAAGNAR